MIKMIDLHCHIIHNADDGSQSLEESLSMAKQAVADGIHTVVATPHTLNGIYTNDIADIILKVSDFQKALSSAVIDLQIRAGADVHICPGMVEWIESGSAGTINNNMKYILVELPHQSIPNGVRDEIFQLKMQGITPIISHPERHPLILRDIDHVAELVRLGALCQLTSMSITGAFGHEVKYCSETLLKYRLVHLIASDAHSWDNRPPVLSHAVERAAEVMGSFDDAERMVTDVPFAILEGCPVEVPEPYRGARYGAQGQL